MAEVPIGSTPGSSSDIAPSRKVTVVVPTYREVDSLPYLVERLGAVREKLQLDLDLLLMDDDSRDGSMEWVASLGSPWVKMVVRTADRGLSQAVLDGLRRADGEFLVVMDADLSHPPEKIPELLSALEDGADMAVGSRFVEGGTTADDWGVLRWLNSRVATILAMPLVALKDPMSGFFALRRSTLLAGRDFNPVGYKIGLELVIKCACQRVVEVPIHFSNRERGESKLTFKEQLRYLQHLRRLYIHKYGTWTHLAQFLVVGGTGLLINLALLTLFLAFGLPEKASVGLAIFLSMTSNFVLNRRFSFSYARERSIVRQFIGFVAASSIGAAINYFTTVSIWEIVRYKQVAAIVGVLAGTLFNFVLSRFIVFREKYVKPSSTA